MTDDNFATSSADLGTGRMDLDLVKDLQVTMHIVLGSTSMTVAEVLDLGREELLGLRRAARGKRHEATQDEGSRDLQETSGTYHQKACPIPA